MGESDSIKSIVSFSLDANLYGIDIMCTHEIIKMGYIRKLPNTPYFIEGMLSLRGEIIPVLNLKKLFNFSTFDFVGGKSIIISKFGEDKFGFVVDKVRKVIEVDKITVNPPNGIPPIVKKYIIGLLDNLDTKEQKALAKEEDAISILNVSGIFDIARDELGMIGRVNKAELNRCEGISFLSFEEEQEIYSFLDSIGFNVNITTDAGIRNAFALLKIRHNKSIKSLVATIKNNMNKNNVYSTFSLKKSMMFFDNRADFSIFMDLFEQIVVAKKQKKRANNIRIVNIGCGLGFDIYSIFFMLKYNTDYEGFNIEYIAIDNDDDNIKKAKEGVCKSFSLQRISKNNLSLLFDKQEKAFVIKGSVRDSVDFRVLSLDDYKSIDNIDICFARKAFAALDEVGIAKFIDFIASSLSDDGILFLSEIEDLKLLENNPLVEKETNLRKYYMKN